jgi:amino acid transporter
MDIDEKHVLPAEKVLAQDHASPTHQEDGNWREQESFMTRNGLNLRSFGRRPVGDKHVPLDKSMKTRHLHMIAIGGSIGAGFFVGSGGALSKGVSSNVYTHQLLLSPTNTMQGPGWLLIDFLIMGVMVFNVGKFKCGTLGLRAWRSQAL